MSVPNIAGLTTVTGRTNLSFVNGTSTPESLVSNPADSDKVFKINTLLITSLDTSSSVVVDVWILRSNVVYYISHETTLAANETLTVLQKNKQIYLEEGDVLRVMATGNSGVHAICSYEKIS